MRRKSLFAEGFSMFIPLMCSGTPKRSTVHNLVYLEFMSKYKNNFRMRKCMSHTKMPVRENNYNNYFVNPELRYKKRTKDPKTVK